MYSLLKFLFQNSAFLVFILLEFFCIGLVINYNDHQANIVNEATTNLTGYIGSKNQNVQNYLSLQREVDSLTNVNSKLQTQVFNLNQKYILDTTEIIDSTRLTYSLIPAKIISNSISLQNNMMILDKGGRDGIQKDMGVIANGSVIGIVSQVKSDYAEVISILNTNMKTVATIEELNAFGSVTWEPFDDRYVVLNDIPKHYAVKEGQHISTSEYSSVFPSGIKIGIIESVASRPNRNDFTIRVKLYNSPYDADLVHVVVPTNAPDFNEN